MRALLIEMIDGTIYEETLVAIHAEIVEMYDLNTENIVRVGFTTMLDNEIIWDDKKPDSCTVLHSLTT